jgi:hypothetical protein
MVRTLRTLVVKRNRIGHLPDELGLLTRLTKLCVVGRVRACSGCVPGLSVRAGTGHPSSAVTRTCQVGQAVGGMPGPCP